MIETAAGLVLRTHALTETSLIIQWLTRDLGRLATVAKGALRPKSPFRGKLDLFYRAEFSFTRSRRSELHTLREITLQDTHARLREDLTLLHQAAYCAALIEQTTEKETPVPNLFELLSGLIRHLPTRAPQPQTVFAFELKLLTELGLQPNLDTSRLTPGAKQLVKALAQSDWPVSTRVLPTPAQAAELAQFLHGFLIYHVGKIPKGRHAALGTPAHRVPREIATGR